MQSSSSAQGGSNPRQAAAGGACPIGRAAAVLGDYWTLVILRHATLGFTRFERLRDELRISDNMLADRLNRLVEARLLVRVPYRDRRRTRQEYRLTEAGAATEPILLALAAWGQEERTGALRGSGPMEVVHTTCGARVRPGPVCPSCGGVLRREDQEWVVPWLSEDPIPLAVAAG